MTGPDGTVELMPHLVRIPDVAFTNWVRFPGRRVPKTPIPRLTPNLVAEILSRSNMPGEMAVKRQDYFTAGVKLVWEIDPGGPHGRGVHPPTGATMLGIEDVLDGGAVLPEFSLSLRDLFAELERQG